MKKNVFDKIKEVPVLKALIAFYQKHKVNAAAVQCTEDGLKIKHISSAIKAVVFLLLCVIGFRMINLIAQPFWNYENFNTTHGIYEEPQNTIETLFAGTSHIHYAISPMELYQKYGICSYDISSSSQPTLATYYWIEEAYRLNPETLDTVIYDVSYLRKDPDISYCHEAIDPMQFSSVKLRAVKAYSESFTDFIFNLIPIFSYHERWKELTEEDFLKSHIEPELYLRGYYFSSSQWISSASDYSDVYIPLLFSAEKEKRTILNDTAVIYFDKMVSFCKEHNIQLVLIKTPTYWASEDHNAIQELADNYGLDFIDFNVDPYYSEIGFNLGANVINTSSKNNLHANFYGAIKMTDYLGQYLVEKCGNKDVRGDEKYEFMNDELEDYNRYIIETKLDEIEDPALYLSYLIDQQDYEIFISVKDDGSESLTDEQRECFATLGLEKLSSIEFRDSYLAVIDDGVVETENIKKYNQDLDTNGEEEEIMEVMSVKTEGLLNDGTVYSLMSCGGTSFAISSCILDNIEYSQNSRGINFVVYDKKLQKVVDNATFDTYESSTRKPVNVELALANDLNEGLTYPDLSSKEQQLYLYNMKCNAAFAEKNISINGMFSYLSYFWDNEDYTIFISAKEDASEALSDETRSFLSDIGLYQLSNLHFQDSYLAIISGGEIWEEICDHGADPIKVHGPGYTIISGGYESGDISSIMINGKEYSPNTCGLNIVVMNNLDSSVVSAVTFNTSEIIQSLPENWLK